MIKTFIVGAVLGFYGKKLYDEGKLDPYLAEARERLNLSSLGPKGGAAPAASKGSRARQQPDLAF